MPTAPTKLRVLSEAHGTLAGANAHDAGGMLDDASFLLGAAVALAWVLGDAPLSPIEWLAKVGARLH